MYFETETVLTVDGIHSAPRSLVKNVAAGNYKLRTAASRHILSSKYYKYMNAHLSVT